MFMNQNNTRNT